MAKIDTSLIAGYADMSAEEKLAALEGYELPKPDMTGYVKKEVLDKATSDAATWKKKYNAQLTDDEKAKQALEEANNAMKEELNSLKREKAISSYTAKFATQGYDAELAAATATAMADGDMDTVFANQAKFIESVRADKAASDMKKTGRPGSLGTGNTGITTKAEFLKLSYEEALAYKQDHPNWVNELK